MALDDAQEAALRSEFSTLQTEFASTKEALTKANREGGQHRARAERVEKALEAAETAAAVAASEAKTQADALRADLTTKADAAEARAAEAKVAADNRTIQAEVRAAAVMAGMKKPDLVKLLDLSVVKLDETGKVIIPPTLFEDAKKSDPYLFGTGNSSNPNLPPPPGPNAPKRAKDMTPEERTAEGKKLGIRV